MGVELVVLAVLFIHSGTERVEAARLFHEMDFGTMQACEKASRAMGRDIERRLTLTMGEYWKPRLVGMKYHIETGAACSRK